MKKPMFLHIPKTAGTSIEWALGNLHIPKYRHWNLTDILEEEQSKKGDFFVFTNIRNTYDRIFSSYLHHKKNKSNYISFKDYVFHMKNYNKNPNEYVTADPYLKIDKNGFHLLYEGKLYVSHFKHYVKFDYWCNFEDLDYVINFESLQEDYKLLKDKYNLGDLQHVGPNPIRNNFRNYRDYYDSESIKIVSKLHGEEIEKYKYTF